MIGSKLVGISFNPGGNPKVDEAKQLAANLIDLVHEKMKDETSEESLMIHNEAIRAIMTAQMWTVKALTW